MRSTAETATGPELPIEAAVVTRVVDMPAGTAATTSVKIATESFSEKRTVKPRRSLREALPVIKMAPYLMFEAFMHTAYLRNSVHGWDLRTHMMISIVRRFMYHEGKTVEEVQEGSKKGLPFQSDEVEALPFVIPVPEEENDIVFLERKIKTAIDRLTKEAGLAEPTIPDPTVVEVPAEWVIKKRSDMSKAFIPADDDVVVIYAHGGAHYLGSAAAHRFLTGQLAESAQVTVLSLDYRLSPQNPLPAALTDFLVSYFYIVETLKVPPSRIVFAGDSSGGCLVLSALNVILYGDDASSCLPIPVGAVVISPWVDMTRCMPSESSKIIEQFDYIPPANFYPKLKPSEAWPAKNGRYWHYAENNAILHPLASPITTPSWKGSCPLSIILSEERLRDSGLLLSRFYKESGNPTYVYYHERLPHVFHLLGKTHPSVSKSFSEINSFIKGCVSRNIPAAESQAPNVLEGKAIIVDILGNERPLPEKKIPDYTYSELRKRMEARMTELAYLIEYLVADRMRKKQ
ncbi:Alpha/Beta hydrolase protein [Lipomyces doorenjongii]